MPTVTVLMTVYNGAKYLGSSIESVLRQRYTNFEFLIVDDCSQDNSVEIVQSFRDNRIRLHKNPVNLGQTKSLNVGLRLAQGAYIARMDADDLAYPGWLQNQMTFIVKNPDYVVVSTRAAVIDGKNRFQKVLNTPLRSAEIILKSLVSSPINHVGSVMNTGVILEAGGYDENYKIAADYDLWGRLLARSYKMITLPRIGVAVRFHSQSISICEQGRRDFLEISQIMQKNIQALTGLDLLIEDTQLLWKFVFNASDMSVQDFEAARDVLKKIYQKIKPSLAIPQSFKSKILKKQMTISYTKKVFASLRDGIPPLTIRTLLKGYFKEYGRGNILGFFFVLSFLGTKVLCIFPRIHNLSSRFLGRFRI